jgi:hypothetical protein
MTRRGLSQPGRGLRHECGPTRVRSSPRVSVDRNTGHRGVGGGLANAPSLTGTPRPGHAMTRSSRPPTPRCCRFGGHGSRGHDRSGRAASVGVGKAQEQIADAYLAPRFRGCRSRRTGPPGGRPAQSIMSSADATHAIKGFVKRRTRYSVTGHGLPMTAQSRRLWRAGVLQYGTLRGCPEETGRKALPTMRYTAERYRKTPVVYADARGPGRRRRAAPSLNGACRPRWRAHRCHWC